MPKNDFARCAARAAAKREIRFWVAAVLAVLAWLAVLFVGEWANV